MSDPIVSVSGETQIVRVESPELVTVHGDTHITTVEEKQVVGVSRETYIVTVCQGLPGAPGSAAGAPQYTAGMTISALKPIVIIAGLAYHADNTDPAHIGRVVGVSTTSANAGSLVTVATEGRPVSDASWNWTSDTLFVGAGSLRQTPPTTGVLQKIAVVTSSDSILVLVGEPTER